MHLRVALISSLLSFSTAAVALDLKPTACGSHRKIDPIVLLIELYGQNGLVETDVVPSEEIKRSTGKQIKERQYLALAKPKTCTNCTPDTIKKLEKAGRDFRSFWNHYARESRSTEALYQTSPLIDNYNFEAVVMAFFSEESTTIRAEAKCLDVVAKKTQDSPKAPAFLENVRIRKKATDLAVDRSVGEKFKPLERATFSASRDYIAATDTYDIEGVIGYRIEKANEIFQNWYELIPYLYYKRQHTARKSIEDHKEVENIGAGLMSHFFVPFWGRTHDLLIYPEILHSARTHVTTLSGSATFTPNLHSVGVNKMMPVFGLDWLSYKIIAQGTATYASLLDNGDGSVLRDVYDSFRYGPTIGFWIGITDGDFSGLSFKVGYDYRDLVTSNSTLSYVAQFTATLAFVLPKEEFWSLNLTYVDGRDIDTFEKQRKITLGLGLKY